MKNNGFIVTALALGLTLLCAVSARAESAVPPQLDKLQRADGAKVVPERFLRSWDPVTVFFERDTGPANGGPEDAPERFVALNPAIPGAWQWLGARALQFRPADAWKPLQRIEFTAEGRTTRLIALLPAPTATSPSDRADGVAGLHEVTLTFAGPVDTAALSRLLSIELRPAPGIDASGAQVLGPQDFTIGALERTKPSDKQSYLISLKSVVPDGRVLVLRLKLADEPSLDEAVYETRIKSAVPFRASDAICGSGFSRDMVAGVMRCTPYSYVSTTDSEEEGEATTHGTRRSLIAGFTAKPQALDAVGVRQALRITPPVDDLAAAADGNRIKLTGRFLADKVYEMRIEPGALADEHGRPLEGEALIQRFAFAPEQPSIKWDAAQGIVERFGPQMVPVRGRGYDKADVRIFAIDPLSRDFWPFPARGVETDDDVAPPLPGNEPSTWTGSGDAEAAAIGARIGALGSPAVSELLPLPIQRGGAEAKFGLDLKPHFSKIAGADQPGTYLVGLRPTNGGKRQWLRAQVTDLSLSAVEEAGRVYFTVTSLSTAKPVQQAQIQFEGVRNGKFVTLAQGIAGADGAFTWTLEKRDEAEIKRIVVTKGLDTLVIEPSRAPAEYAHETWSKPSQSWLSWTADPKQDRQKKSRILCHVFTERPIYRPEEPVHVKGYVRSYFGGKLSYASGGGAAVIKGPGKQEWRIPVKLDERGSFYFKFDQPTPATGNYSVRFEADGAKPPAKQAEPVQPAPQETAQPEEQDGEPAGQDADAKRGDTASGEAEGEGNQAQEEEAEDDGTSCGAFPFKKEAYRLPTFEVVLNSPPRVPLDGEFNADLLARYFAGGLVAERPVKWRVVQFPYAWTPPEREGFVFSSDSRFSGETKFKSSPVLEREGRTDAGGAARITLDTAIEPTAQPRSYTIEATVTGDDDIQVRSVQNVIALPPFVLGIKAPRYVAKPGTLEPEFIAIDGKGEPVAGLEMTVRFVRRNWISTLQASDFSQGAAKYVTQVVDETLAEKKVTSLKEAQRLRFETRESGVYILQIEASDRIGRRQQVSLDLFVDGGTPVTWAHAPAQTATVSADKDAYAPGETATLVIQSPFQTARALAIVEEPEGRFRYDWVDIANGFGRYALGLRKEEMPKLAVHFMIMRGRLPGGGADPTAPFDQGKPVTIAATKWVTVTPVKNIVTAKLEYPEKARPGQTVEVTLRLSDDEGKPLSGEATFWMVDQAVLSLAKEQPLDPLPGFIVSRPTEMTARDTRNMAFGIIPLEETPGGDGGRGEWSGDNNISVRKNFTPVPIYLPSVKVGDDGVAKINVKLPDSLTVFKLRAKAVAGPDRFGYATGEMLIRQALVAQPALPRFVRPGDSFEAGLIGRVVEGPGGTGRAAIAAEGLLLQGAAEQRFAWEKNLPARLAFQVSAGDPAPGKSSVKLRFSLAREADQAADNVEIELPVKPDRPPARQHQIADVAAGSRFDLPAPEAGVRPGSYERTVTLAADASLIRLIGGLKYLVEYPYGCTEQRIALASSALAVKPFAPLLAAAGLEGRIAGHVKGTAQAIEQSIDGDGLVAFWPKARGDVMLTAWAYSFLLSAQKAGEPVDAKLLNRLAAVLKQALRSDYPRLLTGSEMQERVEALAALAEGGKFDQAYAAELARRASVMPTASLAQVTAAMAELPAGERRIVSSLMETLWSRVTLFSRNGRQVYGGLAGESADPAILPSETRNLAEVTRAVALAAPSDARLAVLREGLLRLGEGDGWGSTNANAAAVRALAAYWRKPGADLPVTVSNGAETEVLTLNGAAPVKVKSFARPGAVTVNNGGAVSLVALVDARYQPLEPGDKAQALAQGFVVSRSFFRVPSGGGALERIEPGADGALHIKAGDVIEERLELVNAEDRTHVAVTAPLAAGLEPLNPNLANAPAEAAPSENPAIAPDWASYGDDRVLYAFDRLPKGNYRFAFRTRALVPGSFIAPPAEAETMYQKGVYGASAGRRVVVSR